MQAAILGFRSRFRGLFGAVPDRSVRERQIGLRAHFDQPRHRPLEGEGLRPVARGVDARRLGRGRDHQFDPVVVEGVDERDQAPRRVPLAIRKQRRISVGRGAWGTE